jgi:hypothetical protein
MIPYFSPFVNPFFEKDEAKNTEISEKQLTFRRSDVKIIMKSQKSRSAADRSLYEKFTSQLGI